MEKKVYINSFKDKICKNLTDFNELIEKIDDKVENSQIENCRELFFEVKFFF